MLLTKRDVVVVVVVNYRLDGADAGVDDDETMSVKTDATEAAVKSLNAAKRFYSDWKRR